MTYPITEQQDDLIVPEQPAPVRKNKALPIVLSIAAVLLVCTSIAFGVLISNETTRINAVSAQISDKDQDLAESAQKERDNTDKLAKSQEDKKTAEDAQKKAEVASAPLAPCHDAAKSLRTAVLANDVPAGREALKGLLSVC